MVKLKKKKLSLSNEALVEKLGLPKGSQIIEAVKREFGDDDVIVTFEFAYIMAEEPRSGKY